MPPIDAPVRLSPSGPIIDGIDPEQITPGFQNTALRSTDLGDGIVAAWMPATGGSGAYLVDYIDRAGGNWADALITLLTEVTERPLAVFLPGQDMEIDKQIGDFSGNFDPEEGCGLTGGITFIGIVNATRFIRPEGYTYQAMFAWGIGSSRVAFQGVGWHAEDTNVVGLKAIHTYEYDRWRFMDCEITTGDIPTNQGNGISIGLFGGTRVTFVDSFLDHAQLGCGGLGYGTDGVVFQGNQCENCHDFAVSVVTGPAEVTNLDIKNVNILGNVINGVNGSGAIFVGSDGGSSPADLVQTVNIQGNTINPAVQLGEVGVRTMITFCAGLETSVINIQGNTIGPDTESTQGIYGIHISQPEDATSFRLLNVAGNTIGPLGADGGVNGIYADLITIDASQIANNILDGNRGIFVSNCQKLSVKNNEVYRATSHALHIRASLRDCTELDISKNYLETVGAFSNALLFEVDGNFDMQAWIDDNKLFSDTGSAFAFIPDAGTGSFYETDTKYLKGTKNAAAIAATIFERDPVTP